MKKAKDLMPKYPTEMVKPDPIEVIEKLFNQPKMPNVTFFETQSTKRHGTQH
jgi:hypothetical protein